MDVREATDIGEPTSSLRNLAFFGGRGDSNSSPDLFPGEVFAFITLSCSTFSSRYSKAEDGLTSKRQEKSSSISRPSSIKRKSSFITSENRPSSVVLESMLSSHSSVVVAFEMVACGLMIVMELMSWR